MKTPEKIKKALEMCVSGKCATEEYRCQYLAKEHFCINSIMSDALACIDQLEKKTKWISVKDRMPEACQSVIVHVRHTEEWRNTVLTEHQWHVVEEDIWLGDGWCNNADVDIREVTHWMPMPEPPEEVLE